MQQIIGLGNVMNIRCRTDDAVHQPGIRIHPNVGLHSEVPLIALLGLMHLGITLPRTVLGRARYSNQGGVNNRSGLKQQAPLGQGGVDGSHDLQAQVVGFKKMAKPQDGRFIGQACGTGIKSCKFTLDRRVVQRLLHRRGKQPKPLLKEMNTQHRFLGQRWAFTYGASTTGRIVLDQTDKFRPRFNQVPFVKEHALAWALRDKLKSGGGKANLFHIRLTSQHLTRCKDFSMALQAHFLPCGSEPSYSIRRH